MEKNRVFENIFHKYINTVCNVAHYTKKADSRHLTFSLKLNHLHFNHLHKNYDPFILITAFTLP